MKRHLNLLFGAAAAFASLLAEHSACAALVNASPFHASAIALSETVAGGDSQVSTDFPGGENPSLSLDGTTSTKFLMFDGQGDDGDASDSGLIVFFPRPLTVQEVRFGFANDGPERDPSTFTIEGSNSVTANGTYNFNPILGGAPAALVDDDADWTPILGVAGKTGLVERDDDLFQAAFDARFAYSNEAPFFRDADTFVNNTAYSAYRILFPDLRIAGNGIMQVGEIELYTVEQIPEPASIMLIILGFAAVATRRRS